MASLDFFAVRQDQLEIFDFLEASTDFRIFEDYSKMGEEIREFRSARELDEAFEVGSDRFGNGAAVCLALWSPSVMRKLEVRRIKLDPKKCDGHTFRYSLEGGAIVVLHLGGVHGQVITKSHIGHNSRERALKWGVAGGVDWAALSKISRMTRYEIGTRLAVDKVPGRPILRGAAELWKDGYELRETAKSPHKWTANGLVPVA